MTRRNRNTKLGACLLGAMAMLLGLAAAPADAATPSLGVTLECNGAAVCPSGSVSHSDERVDYTATVANDGVTTASAGDKLTCDATSGELWFPRVTGTHNFNGTFSFQWLSNGAPATGAEEQPTATTGTYQVVGADEGHAVQCVIIGTDAAGAFASFTLPIDVVPLPTPPPAESAGADTPVRPIVSPEFGANPRTCTPPTGWTGSPTWSYQWLRNAEPIAGATGSTYTPEAGSGEPDHLVGLQCEVVGATGDGGVTDGGKVVATSNASPTGTQAEFEAEFGTTSPNNNGNLARQLPRIVPASTTSGPVTLEIELPGGLETSAFRVVAPNDIELKEPPKGWACGTVPPFGAQHAKVVCTRSDPLLPGDSYPGVKVITKLGADAPDTALATATAFGGSAPGSASATNEFSFAPALPFGLSSFEAPVLDAEGHDYTQAGGHPFSVGGAVVLNRKRQLTPGQLAGGLESEYVPIENTKQVITDLPPGFVGNPNAVPQLCQTLKEVKEQACPAGSVVGGIRVVFSGISQEAQSIYAIKPEYGTPAQFAFEGGGGIYTFTARVRPQDGYAASLELAPALISLLLEGKATFCSYGAKTAEETSEVLGCKEAGEAGANPVPLLTNPTRCGPPSPVVKAHLDSWEHPGAVGPEGSPDYSDPNWKTYEYANPETTGCGSLDFEPDIHLAPSAHRADSPTGLDVGLSMPTNGLEGKDEEGEPDPEATSQADLRKVKITFPEGMAVNPSAAAGLGACSAAQIKLGTNKPIECPGSAKVGSAEIETPVLRETLHGDVYIAKQGDVEGSLLGIYLVFESPKDGVLIKLPGKITPDPVTGQLVATVDNSPQQPFSAVHMHFPGGPQATLLTPPKCGTYQIKSELTPWNGGAPVTETSSFDVNQGPDGGACPGGGLDPKFSAGATNPLAGQTSPFVVHLTREDGSQRFSALNLTMPPGLSAYLKGVPYCPDSTLASISSEPGTGQGQIDSPSCPVASQVGTVTAGAGAGPSPFYTDKGRAYLAGPYKGAPLSIAVVTPAVAGPLDLGSVVIRNALYVNPETAQVTVKSDPIPTILHGLLLDVRDIRIAIDRPNFTLNPTDCEELSVGAAVTGEQGATADLSNRFQVGGCENLAFKPKLSLRLKGGTARTAHPKLIAQVFSQGVGVANLARIQTKLPRSAFLDQAHIRTVCTRVQFAAGNGNGEQCPKGSVYGHAWVTTALFDYVISGKVFLRSSNHKLPDLVIALQGPASQPIAVELSGKTDSVKGALRNTFEGVPDAPFEKARVVLFGGKRGLVVNSRNLCTQSKRASRANVRLVGQNGKTAQLHPLVRNSCGKKHKKKSKQHKRARR